MRREQIFARDDYRCVYCGERFDVDAADRGPRAAANARRRPLRGQPSDGVWGLQRAQGRSATGRIPSRGSGGAGEFSAIGGREGVEADRERDRARLSCAQSEHLDDFARIVPHASCTGSARSTWTRSTSIRRAAPRCCACTGCSRGAGCTSGSCHSSPQRGHPAAALSFRGHPPAAAIPAIVRTSIAAYCHDAAEAARALDRPIVIGHSLGGRRAAARLAQPRRAVVLVSSAPPRGITGAEPGAAAAHAALSACPSLLARLPAAAQ